MADIRGALAGSRSIFWRWGREEGVKIASFAWGLKQWWSAGQERRKQAGKVGVTFNFSIKTHPNER